MIAAVLDANVLVSGIAGFTVPTSAPGEVLRAWSDERFHLVVSEQLLAETGRALATPYFRRRLTPEQIDHAITLLREEAAPNVTTPDVSGVASHPEDDAVLAFAVAAGAEYLVTGDHGLLRVGKYGDLAIVSPRQFLAILTNS